MKFNENKGVTLVALTVTIIVILIMTGTVLYNSGSQTSLNRLNRLYIDISNLNTKIDSYYLNYGELPVLTEYISKTELEALLQKNAQDENATIYSRFDDEEILNPNDGEEYYVIDLEKLDGLTINYGYDEQYMEVKQNGEITASSVEDELYIINKTTHQIYFPKGIEVSGDMFFSY